jgi:hypothetical protein
VLKVFVHNKNLLKTVGLAGRMVFFPRKVSTDPEDSGTDFLIFFFSTEVSQMLG